MSITEYCQASLGGHFFLLSGTILGLGTIQPLGPWRSRQCQGRGLRLNQSLVDHSHNLCTILTPTHIHTSHKRDLHVDSGWTSALYDSFQTLLQTTAVTISYKVNYSEANHLYLLFSIESIYFLCICSCLSVSFSYNC